MGQLISREDREYLRTLARRQAEIAALPVMQERKKQWYALNDAQAGARPPVILETWTFDRDFMPESVFRCQGEARGIEHQLLRNIRNHELIDDDKVIPDYFEIGWWVHIQDGPQIVRHMAKDSQGQNLGWHDEHQIVNLAEDLHKLTPPVCSVDRQGTAKNQAFIEELLGDILPVKLTSGCFGNTFLTSRVVDLMGMENFFLAMYDQPEQVHQLMGKLRDNCLAIMHWAEKEQLLRVNNQNDQSFGSSYNFTTRLPAAGYQPPAARLCDMFCAANSQETVGISTEMFHEFCFPYYQAVTEPMGLLYYGCCEPTHVFWDDISRLPHLKKVSVNRWTDEEFIGEVLRGTGRVLSRKPDPNFLGVDVQLKEKAWSEHIGKTLQAGRGGLIEFIIRDVYTLHGNIAKGRRAVELAKRQIDQHWQ